MDCGGGSRINLLQSSNLLRSSNEYATAVDDYLDHAFSTRVEGDEITCPCKKCYHRFWHRRDEVYDHLIVNGIGSKINQWHVNERGISAMSSKTMDFGVCRPGKHDDTTQLRADLSSDHRMENSQKRRASYSGFQLYDGHNGDMYGLVDEDEDEDVESSDEDVFEENVADPEDMNGFIYIEDNLTDQAVSQKRKRGPTMCKDVHGKSINERKLIVLNELGQPIGPSSSTLDENKVISYGQKDRHTTGPISFARKRCELERAVNIPSSVATLYRKTRKRKPERKYETTYETEPNIMKEVQTQEHCRRSGRCTNRVKGPSKSGMLIPDEFLQSFKADIVKEAAGEVMLSRTITDPSNNPVNGQSSSGINVIDQCQNNGDKNMKRQSKRK